MVWSGDVLCDGHTVTWVPVWCGVIMRSELLQRGRRLVEDAESTWRVDQEAENKSGEACSDRVVVQDALAQHAANHLELVLRGILTRQHTAAGVRSLKEAHSRLKHLAPELGVELGGKAAVVDAWLLTHLWMDEADLGLPPQLTGAGDLLDVVKHVHTEVASVSAHAQFPSMLVRRRARTLPHHLHVLPEGEQPTCERRLIDVSLLHYTVSGAAATVRVR